MKKLLLLILPLLFIVGCADNAEKTTICTLNSEDKTVGYSTTITYTISHKNKQVHKVDIEEKVESNDEELLDYFEEYLQELYTQLNDVYGGYQFEIIRTETSVSSNTILNYKEMDLDLFVRDQPSLKPYVNKNNTLKLDGVISVYEELKATCK